MGGEHTHKRNEEKKDTKYFFKKWRKDWNKKKFTEKVGI